MSVSDQRVKNKNRSRNIRSCISIITVIIILVGIFGAAVFVFGSTGNGAADLNVIKAAYLRLILMVRRAELITPADSSAGLSLFALEPGSSADEIGEQLSANGVIVNPRLFSDYLVYYGYDRALEAGIYEVSPSLTIPQLADMFTSGDTARIVLRVIEGWRREQIAQAIDSDPLFPFTGDDFLRASDPGAIFPDLFVATGDLIQGASLEGFLYPDTYIVPVDSSVEMLIEMMTNAYLANVTDVMRADAAAQGLSMYDVMTLASIVEREVIYDEEGADVAAVYLNRLEIGMRLEADPTVQYALGYSEEEVSWWPVNLVLSDFNENNSPFNTYFYPGLPPAPIANPGVAAIRAVIYPEDSPFFFFRAACDASGMHNFAVTYEVHLANGCP